MTKLKLKYKLATSKIGDDVVAVAIGDGAQAFNGMIKLNKEGADIINLLSSEIELDDLIDTLSEKYLDTPRQEIAELVKDFIEQLKLADLLE